MRFRPVLFLLLFTLTMAFCLVLAGPASAEGERYDRLEVPVPVPLVEENPSRDLEAEVIVAAFTRANKSLDRPTASKYAHHVLEAALEFGVDPFMIASIIIRESTVRQNARSRYALGLMQVNWKAHRKGLTKAFREINTADDLLKPRNNVLAGTYIFSWYLNSCGGDVDRALSRYLGRTGGKYVTKVQLCVQDMKKELEKYRKKYGTLPLCSTLSKDYAIE